MNLKGNIKALPVDFFPITTTDVVRHLQDQLGFQVHADFSVWDNRSPWEKPDNRGSSYVIMRAIFRPQDITIPNQSQNYMERLVQASGAGIQYQKDVISILKKFMFPQDMARVQNMPEELQRLAKMGIYGERLQELMRRPNMFYEPIKEHYGCYLRPERIIYDMFVDLDAAEPNTLAGKVDIVKLEDSDQAETIKWGVLLWHGTSAQTIGNYGVTIDDVFQQQIPR
ncbi:MAG: hypothetical protein J5614_01040 [Paludibacteraceae bacterium]|nr:hypothetical protein [Paludibacteraceae bacterium]